MDRDVVEFSKRSIKEYIQRNSEMVGNRGYQGIQYRRGHTTSTTTRYMFADFRDQLSQLWNEDGLRYLYREFLMCEMVDPFTSGSTRVVCAAAIKTKNYRKNHRKDYKVHIEGYYMGEKLKREGGLSKIRNKIHGQVRV